MQVSFISDGELRRIKVGLKRNATKEEREEVERILELRGFLPMLVETGLKAGEWRGLRDGLVSNPAKVDLSEAKRILEEHGFRHKKDVDREIRRRGKRPGPKKRSATNPTEEDLRRLVGSARAALGLKAAETRTEVLGALHRVLWGASNFLSENFVVSSSDVHELSALIRRGEGPELASISLVGDVVRELRNALRELADSGGGHEVTIHTLTDSRWSDDSGDVDALDEGAQWLRLARDLGLDLPALVERAGSRFAGEGGLANKAASGQDDPESEGFEAPLELGDVPYSRLAILTTGLARLTHLRALFADCGLAIPGCDLENVWRIARSDEPWYLDDSPAARYMGDVGDFLLGLATRQGIYPFQHEKAEEWNLRPDPAEEGEVSTGGYLDTSRRTQLDARLGVQAAQSEMAKEQSGDASEQRA